MIISSHIPKTAGMSFSKALQDAYRGRLLLDYEDYTTSLFLRHKIVRVKNRWEVFLRREEIYRKYDVIHGHFALNKYNLLFKELNYCAFFREPIARCVSQYIFWKKHPELINDNSQLKKMIESNMDFESFSQQKDQRVFYRIFLGSVPVDKLSFIGLTEAYEDSLRLFKNIFGKELMVCNENRSISDGYLEVSKDEINSRVVKEAQKDNDFIYDQARRRFEYLLKIHS
ncbi:MAG: sulfotransferase family 2 domain-containing protein [Anaplasmataceae bacterium]|nr:sulfotransferase family 2 domain-containing protein [Anaplasmataceae bacterium]